MAKPKNVFELSKQKAKLASVNVRAENHGDDLVLAADLKFSVTVSNDILSEFHPSLKSAFYKKNDSPQSELPINDPGALTALKFPNMSPFSLSDKYKGYGLLIPYGTGGKSDIANTETEVDSFHFVPKDGGSVDLSFRVIIKTDGTEIGRICEFLKREVEITLTPPDEVELQEAA